MLDFFKKFVIICIDNRNRKAVFMIKKEKIKERMFNS